MDISLYGHLTLDHIYTGFKQTESLGSIANVWRSLAMIDPSINVSMVPTEIGSAIVYVDETNSKRYSKAVLSQKIQKPTIVDSAYSVVMYLNELKETSFLKQLKGIVCADVCVGKPLDHTLLKYVDILFVADTEVNTVVNLNYVPENTCVIVHSPSKSWDNNGNEYTLPKEELLTNVNVLGAGDIYLSCYLRALLKDMTPSVCLQFAHIETTKILKDYK